MINFIHYSLFSVFYYWGKPVMDRLGHHRQNSYFMTVIRRHYWFSTSPNGGENWYQSENTQSNPNSHTPRAIQIPIVPRHFLPPGIHPAVSSLGACPTPAP